MDIQMMLTAQTGKPAPQTQGGAAGNGQFAQNLAKAGRHGGNDLAKLAKAGPRHGADPAQLAKQANTQAQASTPSLPGKAGQANALAEALAAHGLSNAVAEALQGELPETQADLEAIRQRIEAVMAEHNADHPQGETEIAARPDANLEELLAALVDDNILDEASAKAIEAAVRHDDESPHAAGETTIAALQQVLASLANDTRQARTTSPSERSPSESTASVPTALRADEVSLESLLTGQRREAPATGNRDPRPAAPSLDARAVEAALMTERQNASPHGVGSEGGRAVANEAATALAGGAAHAQGSTTFSPTMVSASATATGPTPSQASLNAPVQSPAWPGQLGQQLVQFARQGGEQRIEMRLHPAELGPLSVTLKMSEQGAQAQFLSAHAPVRQAIEQAIPQLREALAQQGIELHDASVGEQRQQDGQAFAGGEGRRDPGQGSGDLAADAITGDGEASAASDGLTAVGLDGRVNLYA